MTTHPGSNQRLAPHALQALLMIYASIQFAALTLLAMLVYPGGAIYQLDSNHYLFLRNFFSDLGATSTPSGRSNLPSHLLFIVALGSVGIALIYFAPAWKVIAARAHAAQRFGIAAQALAIGAGLGFIGIAATPWNHFLEAHNRFVLVAFGILLLYVLCLFILQRHNQWPAASTSLNAAYLVLLVAYVGLLVAGPTLDTARGVDIQVAAQKVIVYASIGNIALQAYAIRREARRRPS